MRRFSFQVRCQAQRNQRLTLLVHADGPAVKSVAFRRATAGLSFLPARPAGIFFLVGTLNAQLLGWLIRHSMFKEDDMAHQQHQSCIDACDACAAACDHCATACLSESNVAQMAECIRNDMDCADVCRLAPAAMARGSRHVKDICALCASLCEACAAECEKHEHEHCKQCAEACRACAAECRAMA